MISDLPAMLRQKGPLLLRTEAELWPRAVMAAEDKHSSETKTRWVSEEIRAVPLSEQEAYKYRRENSSVLQEL